MRRGCTATFLTIVLAAGIAGAAELPTPEEAFGFRPGADRKLVDYEELTSYLERLAALSPRLELREVGRSPLDRPMYVLFASSPANIERLDELREVNRRLALEPDLGTVEREALVEDGRVFVLLALSMHSTEVGPAQALPLLAHELATTEDPQVLAQLGEAVLMIVPNHNPDGMDMVVEHYRSHLGTPLEGSSLPGVYHRYVGHDNNRDFVSLTQSDTRVVNRLFSTEWYPQVMVEKHQMGMTGPRYFVPPNHDPIALNIDERLWRWAGLFGAHLAEDMGAAGLEGVVQSWAFDNYWPGSTETSLWKGVVSLLTEAASCRVATPVYVEPGELAVRGKGLSDYAKSVNMPDPWPGGWWRLGDIVEYELVSSRSLLATAAAHRRELLALRNEITRREVERGRSQAPFYAVLPPVQHDRGALDELAELLAEHGVEVYRLARPVEVAGFRHAAGAMVVPMAQPYRAFVKEMMEPQRYPERRYEPGGEVIRPYDITSWSLPLHRGLDATLLDVRSSELEAALEPWPAERPRAVVPGRGWVAYPAGDRAGFVAAFEGLGRQLEVGRLERPLDLPDGGTLPAGSFVLRGPRGALQQVVRRAGVAPITLAADVGDAAFRVTMPRVGLVETIFHDMDAGWARFVLDRTGVPFEVVRPAELAEDGAFDRFDVLLIPDSQREVLVHGRYDTGDGYRLADYPPELARGMGEDGLKRLAAFVDRGGVVVSWGRSAELFTEPLALPVPEGEPPLEFQLPVRDLSGDLADAGLDIPGSWLRVEVTPDHPATWGLPASSGVFSRGRPVLATSIPTGGMERRVLAAFPERDVLASGWAEREDLLARRAAAVWLSRGKGQVLLLGFSPHFRASTPASEPWLLNGVLLPSAPR